MQEPFQVDGLLDLLRAFIFAQSRQQIDSVVLRCKCGLSEIILLPNVLDRVVLEQSDILMGDQHDGYNDNLKEQLLNEGLKLFHCLLHLSGLTYKLNRIVETFRTDKVSFTSQQNCQVRFK